MEEVNSKNLLVMKLIHYFMVKKDYVPIIIRGVDNEIWLENPKGEFRIIRIVTKNIFNNEQFDFDSFKTKNIVSQIMKQTFNPFIDVLTIYTDIGDNFKKEVENTKKYKYITIENEEDIEDNDVIKRYFKDMKDDFVYESKEEYDILGKITNDISNKNIDDNERFNKNMSKKNNKPIVTYAIIAINVIVFILMYILGKGSENTETLTKFGAHSTLLIKSGQYYRIFTCAFLHIGLVHLFCNMFSLFEIGPTIEYFYGKRKLIVIYLYSILTSSLFVMLFQNPNSITAGASGALFGLLGAMLYFGYSYRGYMGNQIVSRVLTVILLNLFIGFTVSGISNAGHIGGFIGGLVMAYMLKANIEEKNSHINGAVIAVILTGFLVYMAFFR